MIKCPRYHPNLEVINGKGVLIMGIIVQIVKKIVTGVIGRFVYDWLKEHL